MSERKHDYQPGDIIEWCGEKYRVIQNYGWSGQVETLDGAGRIGNFYWDFKGEEARRIESAPPAPR